ncbi:MAG TPA: Gfo/Idh/MocA family oxidoreductase [Pirellulales bacterium]|jgi:xylose dehydrogenase (NAD/NADP)|nr:Gfo/Idh/MocA family oxidoreductase [Pirellulales bacterium]
MRDEPVRWGLLSTARINERIIPAIRASPRSKLLAVASSEGAEKAQRYASTWNIPWSYGSYPALLADPEVDAVYISLPNALHREWTIAAARAGKHVLCEKPLATSVAEVDEMVDAARRQGVVLQEAVMMRYHPQTLQLRELVAAGAIGEVRLMRGVFSFTLDRPGDIRLDATLGGGSIWDLGSYPVSLMRAIMATEPIEVHGWQSDGRQGADLGFAGHLRFPNNTMAQFFSSFQAAPHAHCDLLGSSGRIESDLPYLNKIGVSSHIHIWRTGGGQASGTFSDAASDVVEEVKTYDNVNAYQNEIEAMNDSILAGAEPVVPLTDSRGNVATLEALCASARQGAAVSLEGPTVAVAGRQA